MGRLTPVMRVFLRVFDWYVPIGVIMLIVYGLDATAHYEADACEVQAFDNTNTRRDRAMWLLFAGLAGIAGGGVTKVNRRSTESTDSIWMCVERVTNAYKDKLFSLENVCLLASLGFISASLWYIMMSALTGSCTNTADAILVGRVENVDIYAGILASLIVASAIADTGFQVVGSTSSSSLENGESTVLQGTTATSMIRCVMQTWFAGYVAYMMDKSDAHFANNYINKRMAGSACAAAFQGGVMDGDDATWFEDHLSLAKVTVPFGVVTVSVSATMRRLAYAFVFFSVLEFAARGVDVCYGWVAGKPMDGPKANTLEAVVIFSVLTGGFMAAVFGLTLQLENIAAGCPTFESDYWLINNMYWVFIVFVLSQLLERMWSFMQRTAAKSAAGNGRLLDVEA
jgi:hypothetical protein